MFPGAKVHPPPKDHQGFEVADGKRLRHEGYVYTDVRTVEGKSGTVRWKNGKVAMPILSTHEIARNKCRLEYDENDGVIRNKDTGDTTKFVQAAGVYFVQLLVPRDIAKKPFQPFAMPG